MQKASNILTPFKNDKGFTLLELLVVIGIISILLAMGSMNFFDSRKKANDTLALNDAKNLITVASNNFFDKTDVLYTRDYPDGRQIGASTNTAAARPPVYTLSPGVQVRAVGFSSPDASGSITFWAHHAAGTGISAPTLGSGVPIRSYYVELFEDTGEIDTSFTNNQ